VIKMKRRFFLVFGLVILVLFVCSCGDEDGGPNMAPDTVLTSFPPEGSTHSYRVQMVWTGTDNDGWVTGYELAWYSGVFSGNDFDTLSWVETSSKESTFVLPADSCCVDGENYSDHTFFVRAIDNDQARDETPAHVSFTATTMIPRTTITYPDWPPGVYADTLSPCVTVRWQGEDDDGQVVASRYVWKLYNDPWQEPPLPEDPRWSPWLPTNRFTVRLDRHPDNPWGIWVQSKDDAGAIEKVFKEGRNFIVVYIGEYKVNLPSISICCVDGACYGKQGPTLGCRSTADTTEWDVPITVDVGDTVCFTTSFLPGEFARQVTHIAFRFNDPGEPGSWLDATRG
jgi:hypothetical protein